MQVRTIFVLSTTMPSLVCNTLRLRVNACVGYATNPRQLQWIGAIVYSRYALCIYIYDNIYLEAQSKKPGAIKIVSVASYNKITVLPANNIT